MYKKPFNVKAKYPSLEKVTVLGTIIEIKSACPFNAIPTNSFRKIDNLFSFLFSLTFLKFNLRFFRSRLQYHENVFR